MFVAALAAWLAGPVVGLAADLLPCPRTTVAPIALQHVKDALQQNHELTVVAVGSSSTEGARASDIAHSYPAMLQADLEAALPGAQVAVINRGVGGEDAAEELGRLDRDVMAVRPVLVIWQVGANGAMTGLDPALFKHLVDTGVRRMRDAGIDVVLMDNQRSPKVLASPTHAKIDQALADVAGSTGAALFGRGRLMDMWQDAGFPYAAFSADDGIHHNDRGYACVAKALATSIVQGLGPNPMGTRSLTAQR